LSPSSRAEPAGGEQASQKQAETGPIKSLRDAIRFHATEISRTEAMTLVSRRLCSLNAGDSPTPQALP